MPTTTHRVLAYEGERILICWTVKEDDHYVMFEQEVTIPPKEVRTARGATKTVFRATEDNT